MEYLNHITDKVTSIDEESFRWTNVFDLPEIIYGFPIILLGNLTRFQKYNNKVKMECEKKYVNCLNAYKANSFNCSGGFLRFKTNSKKIMIKGELRRKWNYLKMTLWNSSGFDVYEVENDEYIHKTVFAPQAGQAIFCEIISHNPDNEIVIYLPNYNEVINLYIGSEADILPVDSVGRPAIAFYGNSVTQGCAASRSGNSFVNIVSRFLNCEVCNFSISACCKGWLSVADIIGMLNFRAIVIDFSKNAANIKELMDNHLSFYLQIRKYHKNIPIILMSTSNYTEHKIYKKFDDVILDTYNYAKANNHNTYFIDQMKLVNENQYDLCSIDGSHYNEFSMFKVAEVITNIIKEEEQKDYYIFRNIF